jgi:hypothetical protein
MSEKTRGGRWLKFGLRQSMLNQGLLEPEPGECVMDPQRTLSDADVKAIAKAVLKELIESWYVAAGHGFTRMASYVFVAAIMFAALWFYVRGK